MAQLRNFTLKSDHDGLKLSVMTVLPDDGRPKALLQLAHGMSEHKERYIPFMEFMAQNGIGCIINDHRGHGGSIKSRDDLGYFYKDGANALLKDLNQITQHFKKEYPGLRLFLFGHSMGSLAVRAYRLEYEKDIDGLIVCGSPGKNPAANAGLMLLRILKAFRGERHISKLFINMTTGGFQKRYKGTDESWLSANRENVIAYAHSPLCGFPFTLNGYEALLTLMKEAYDPQPAKNPELPILFISGADDACAPDKKGFDAAVSHMKQAGYLDVRSKMYPNMRHEILNETDRHIVYRDVLETINLWNNRGILHV